VLHSGRFDQRCKTFTVACNEKVTVPHRSTIDLLPSSLWLTKEICNAVPLLRNHLWICSQARQSALKKSSIIILHSVQLACCMTVFMEEAKVGTSGSRSWVTVCLRASPCHEERSVALVMSLDIGHVSPQCHMKFDDFFEVDQS
jgi:hypothetical protein